MLHKPETHPRDYGFKAGDSHLVISAIDNTAKMYSYEGEHLWTKPALPMGQHPNWKESRGDTPPGVYYIGQVWRQYQDPPSHFDRPYGHICFDLVDCEGNEDRNARAGIAIHGGGSSLPGIDYWADYQKLVPTHGCVRMHNRDLYLIDERTKLGKVWVSVYQDDA